METGFLFRASWPITDPDLPMSVLRTEACREIDALAMQAGARIAGDITWTIHGERLIAQAAAEPVAQTAPSGRAAWGSVQRHRDDIEAMLAAGRGLREIAATIGCSTDAVRGIRRETAKAAA